MAKSKWKPTPITSLAVARAVSTTTSTPEPTIALPTRQQGVVASFDHEKGFGFIKPDVPLQAGAGRRDIFVHQSAIKMSGYRMLRQGQRVEFEIDFNDSRGARAMSVSQPGGKEFDYGFKPEPDLNVHEADDFEDDGAPIGCSCGDPFCSGADDDDDLDGSLNDRLSRIEG